MCPALPIWKDFDHHNTNRFDSATKADYSLFTTNPKRTGKV